MLTWKEDVGCIHTIVIHKVKQTVSGRFLDQFFIKNLVKFLKARVDFDFFEEFADVVNCFGSLFLFLDGSLDKVLVLLTILTWFKDWQC